MRKGHAQTAQNQTEPCQTLNPLFSGPQICNETRGPDIYSPGFFCTTQLRTIPYIVYIL
jgi:hypothetical protein